ncbi:MAG: 3'-5' exonuclease [Candidatus Nitrosoglobus sp.]
MEFRIAHTFLDSLARLAGEEQKAVKTTAFDLHLNLAQPGMRFHKLERAKDPHFCSISVNRDIRLIIHKTKTSLLLCYVDHHDSAYRWAERRKLETHPKTGAAQLVEIRERIEEIAIPRYVEAKPSKPALFASQTEEELLSYGVPSEWINDVRCADEDSLLELADHLPSEAAEALLTLATGGTLQVTPPAVAGADPFTHPDAQRRFRVTTNLEELERALAYPWEKWTVFLHPAQRQWAERDYNGPARISGSAGTGKTIVALHRAVFLARAYPDARILLTTFSDTLANALNIKLRRLISHEPRIGERLEVQAINALGLRLYTLHFGPPQIPSPDTIQQLLSAAARKLGELKFSLHFLLSEWEEMVDARQLDSWEAYRDVKRLGRKTRLPEQQRAMLWPIFAQVRSELKIQGLTTYSSLFNQLASQLAQRKHSPFDFAIVDEAQDISIAQLRFLVALGGQRHQRLFFTGDLGQRIFQQPFSWKAFGADIRGRSHTLRINYRTSHQIRMQADRLLGQEVSDTDGNIEERRGTVSVFNGPHPTIQVLYSIEEEGIAASTWLLARSEEGISPNEIGVFVRSVAELDRARAAVTEAGLPFKVLDESLETANGYVSISTMHLAKGLEFRAVMVMACDDEIIPSLARLERVTDEADLEEVYNTERHLLYVACTRARDHLLVTGVNPASEFLDDLRI